MMRSAVTICLVPEARGGPFIFWDDLAAGCRKAAALGFDAVEVFPPSGEALSARSLRGLLSEHGLGLAAVGTGAGWVLHRWHLCHAQAETRQRARQFIREIIERAAEFGAPAILGSMQGRWEGPVSRTEALQHLTEALQELGERARACGTTLLYEPLNRYETNLVNRLEDAVALVQRSGTDRVKLLADLFHMNIEETSLAEALRTAGPHLGHVHFADSNRRPAGFGHTDFGPVAAALQEIGYEGYASAEALPFPDPDHAAAQTIRTFRQFFRAPA